jgi:FixJ family two-component response regulator
LAKVFIVDDDPSVRKALSRLMKSAGIECGTFSSGQSFLASLKDEDRGCVLLDYHMPGSDGPDVLKIMAETRVPVIMLSAHDDPETRERARSLGAVAFFRKPVDGQALLDAIAWAMGTKHA